MIHALIVEDEKNNSDRLIRLLKKSCPDVEVAGVADSVHAALVAIEKHIPNLIFLDIELPDGNGFDVLEKSADNEFDVIFVTAHDKYAIKAIKFSAADYLLKPIDEEELKKAIEKIKQNKSSVAGKENLTFLRQQINNNDFSKIALPTINGYQFVALDEVVRCQADRNYTQIYLSNGKNVLVSRTLGEFEELLEEHNFYRIHHAYLINLKHLKEYVKGEGGHVLMSDGSRLDVSKRKKDDFLSRLHKI